ncbi:MAG: hypothetical protein KatS3mg095_0072 [Candidatus Parcubacteria bacterium]|nr:MAG: hypothetical protein KatS3mg095_0072 [Candidatus Parcubacteria bacterium]
MENIFYLYLVKPIVFIFLYFYQFLKDAGLTIILVTILLKIVLMPLNYFIYLEEEKIKKVNKKINEATKNVKDFIKKSEIISKIYKEENISPFKNIFLQLINLPLLIAFFISIPQFLSKIDNSFLFNIINLKNPNIFLGIFSFLIQMIFVFYFSNPEHKKISLFISSALIPIFFILPSSLLIYILTTIILTILERKIIFVQKI